MPLNSHSFFFFGITGGILDTVTGAIVKYVYLYLHEKYDVLLNFTVHVILYGFL